jgi:TrmH family RNA methyltransferase
VAVQISSAENPKVKTLRSLHRRPARYGEGLLLVEGVRLVEEALQAGCPLHVALYEPERLAETPRGRALLATLTASPAAFSTTPRILDSVADTATPQGVVAAVPFPELSPRPEGLVLILDQLRDPGNCGTILRTAEAAGVGLVCCAPGTVDPFSPKVVRAGMGAHFRLPLRAAADWEDVSGAVVGRQVLLAEAHGGRPYDAVDWRRATALIVGGEAEGASEQARQLASDRVSIPMAGTAESLNAAVAAGILLFEALRQRREC